MSARYEFIDGEKGVTDAKGQKKYAVVKMCEWLEVSCSGYYGLFTDEGVVRAARRCRAGGRGPSRMGVLTLPS